MEKPVLAAMLSLSGTSLTDDEKYLLEAYNPFGITLFNRNIVSAEQLSTLTKEITETVGHSRIFLAADQEGGRVNRLKAAGFPDYAFQRTLGKIDDTALTEIHCELMARDMRSVGINLNFAPVLDIDYPQTTAALKGRCFGSDPELIIRHGRVVVKTYLLNGICPCIKHVPGHGRAQNDPHLGLPRLHLPLADLQNDFAPFRALKDCPTAMTAHMLVEAVDPERPISVSAKGTDFIRNVLEYQGILISDSIDMRALSGSIVHKAEAVWQAGGDIVCYCGGQTDENRAICELKHYLDDQTIEKTIAIHKMLATKKKLINLDHNQKRYYTLIRQFRDDDIQYDATETLHQMFKGE